MTTREIVTLQFGNYSNFVGTHYWNSHYKRILDKIQNEDNSEYVNKLFRETGASKTGYTPRTICFDIKSKLQSLKQDGTFSNSYENMDTGQNESSPNDCVVYSETEVEKNKFLEDIHGGKTIRSDKSYGLDEKVETWSDFMTYELNDHSMQLLTQSYKDGEEFFYFGLGAEECTSMQEEFEDNLHFWTEECDYMEGFEAFVDLQNGYCGLASKALEFLSDEYNQKSKLAFLNWAFVEDVTPKDKIYHYLNIALTLQAMKQYSSLSVIQSTEKNILSPTSDPVKVPYFEYNNTLDYHTSAILAAAVDSTTIPLFNVKSGAGAGLGDLCGQVRYGNWCLAGSAIGIPFNTSTEDGTLFDRFIPSHGFYGDIMTSLFPSTNKESVFPTSHVVVLQNILENKVCPSTIDRQILEKLFLNYNPFTRNPLSVVEFFNEHFYPCERTVSKIFYTKERLRTELPYPSILESFQEKRSHEETLKLSTISSLFTSADFYDFLSEVLSGLRGMNLNKFHSLDEFGLDKDTLNELIEDVIEIAQAYNHKRMLHEMEE